MRVVAFCGTRGLPASYGGFETAVDEISRHFVEDGRACDVFCRRSSSREGDALPEVHERRNLIYVSGSQRAVFDTFVSSFQTGLRLLRDRKRYAHVFWFNNANLPGIVMTRLSGIPMSVNTDGLEWRRAKWSLPFKIYYVASSFLISRICRTLVSDSIAIQDYYKKHFLKQTTFIPYGSPPAVHVTPERELEILEAFELKSGRYFLQITRVEPDNLPLEIATSFQESGLHEQGFSMVSIGYKEATSYAEKLMALNGQRGVRIHKAVYDPAVLQVLRKHCCCYLHGNSVGGTNPALLEAMTVCPRVAAVDCEFNREVLADTGWFFTPTSASSTIRRLSEAAVRSDDMRARIAGHYQWAAVSESYAALADGKAARYAVTVPQF